VNPTEWIASAVALFEGYVPPVAEEDDLASLGAAIERTGAAAADGRLAHAARAFAPLVLTDAEFAALDGDFFERCGGSIPAMLQYFRQNLSKEGPWPYDPEQLAKISAPVVAVWSRETARSTWSRNRLSTWPSTSLTDTSVNWPVAGTLPRCSHQSSSPRS
jgi:hypothetical protein